MTTAIDQLQGLLVPAIDSLGQGLSLWGIEFTSGPASALLRIYIDAHDRPVTIEDCEAVSREVSALLDVEDPIPGNYTLEVSSPGIDRLLFTPEQFSRYAGEQAKLTLALPMEGGRRRLQGRIVAVDGQAITLATESGDVVVEHSNIQKAKIVPVYDTPAKPSEKPARPRRKSNAKPSNPGTA